jgi:cobyrinic acid a,c-diamide synthase
MYLARSIDWQGRSARMVGAIPGDVVMHERPVGRGYVRVEETVDFPWSDADAEPALRLGHEFHHSSLENLDPSVSFAYRVQRGHGVDGRHDGVLAHNVLASYIHLRHTAGNDWPRRFIAFVRRVRAGGGACTARACEGERAWSTR